MLIFDEACPAYISKTYARNLKAIYKVYLVYCEISALLTLGAFKSRDPNRRRLITASCRPTLNSRNVLPVHFYTALGETLRGFLSALLVPGAFVVEEENKVEFLSSLLLSLLSESQHILRWHGDGHAVMQHALLRHVRVYDLPGGKEKSGFMHTLATCVH